MNVVKTRRKEDKKRKIIYILIILICIISISVAVYTQFFKDEKLGLILGINNTNPEKIQELRTNFTSLFTNDVEIIQEFNTYKKQDDSKEIVYTSYSNKKDEENKYLIDINIPYINIDNKIIEKYNEEIQSIFESKEKSILSQTNETDNIYSVNYKAYVFNDILSLVIYSNLKEGYNPQRVIVKTYNYNLKKEKEETVENLLRTKNISILTAEDTIKKEIKEIQKKNERLQELGYSVYSRDYTSNIYKLATSDTFFIGRDGYIYIIYAYGNNNFTSEMDLVIF